MQPARQDDIGVETLILETDDIIKAIIPEELHDEIPSGFNTAGHIGTVHRAILSHPFATSICLGRDGCG
jgi:hypothetical protein